MSAILAVFNRNGEPADRRVLDAMMACSLHRGPNGQNALLAGPVAFGHQHFWLAPEEVGETQPVSDAANGLLITCDARLDNRSELTAALGIRAGEARSLSDALLVLAAYRRWGTDCARHLLGDFAFAIWDQPRNQLFLVRDPLGMRDLCYYVDTNRFLVASEVRQVLQHSAVPRRLNEGRVAEYLCLTWSQATETFYEGVSYFPPGHCMVVTADCVRQWRFWDVNPGARVRYRDERDYSEHFRTLLIQAVGDRLRCARPVGVSLSGGLDSTSVAAVAAEALAPERLKSFSYVFEELNSCDERRYIEPVVRRWGLEPTYLDGDSGWTLRDLATWPSTPDTVSANSTARLPLMVLNAAKQQGCRVLLTGSGGDQLFLGEGWWLGQMMSDRRAGALLRVVCESPRRGIAWRQDLFERGVRTLVPKSARAAYRRLRPRPVVIYHPGLDARLVGRTGLARRVARPQAAPGFDRPGQWEHYTALMGHRATTGAAMARHFFNLMGVEELAPFQDCRLVAYALAIPADQLGRRYRPKWVLRNALAGYLPEVVRERTYKTSFQPLRDKGLWQEEQATVRQVLADPQIVQRGFVRSEWLEEELGRGPMGCAQNGSALWACIALELWLRRYW